MNFITVDSYEELSKIGARIIASVITLKNNCVLGLATGSSPVGIYDELIKKYNEGRLDFSKVTSINLDEYVGLDGSSDQSYRYFMNEHLFNHVNIDINNTYVPNGKAENIEQFAKEYDERIEKLGIDIQLLGIGPDGHIAFNEPDDCFTLATHEVKLLDSTIEANSRFFASREDVPTSAVTMGIKGIMSAKKILLVANGAAKKDVLYKAFFGPVTPQIPASILQLHPDVTVIFTEN